MEEESNEMTAILELLDKAQKYIGDNILAQALNSTTHQNNPQFTYLTKKHGLGSAVTFTKDSISDRAKIYLQVAVDI